MVWLVVNFTQEDCVEAVPKKWFVSEKSECFWPPETKRDKIWTMIKHKDYPQENWTIHKVEVLGQYDNLSTAERKANKAKKQDDLSSSQNEEVRGRGYRIRKKKHYESDSDNDDSGDSSSPDLGNLTFPKFNAETLRSTTTQKTSSINNRDNIPSVMSSDGAESTATAKSTTTAENTVTAESAATAESTATAYSEFQKRVLRELHTINLKLFELADFVYESAPKSKPLSQEAFPSQILDILPVNEQTLIQLEEWLVEIPNQNILAQELSRIGGHKLPDIVRRIMYRVFTNEVGSLYSWEGAKKKKIFKNLKIANVILKTVRLVKVAEGATENEIINIIKAWLVRCKDRMNNAENHRAEINRENQSEEVNGENRPEVENVNTDERNVNIEKENFVL